MYLPIQIVDIVLLTYKYLFTIRRHRTLLNDTNIQTYFRNTYVIQFKSFVLECPRARFDLINLNARCNKHKHFDNRCNECKSSK